jgi:hypothetical protein
VDNVIAWQRPEEVGVDEIAGNRAEH